MSIHDKRRLNARFASAPATAGEAVDARFEEKEDVIVFGRINRGRRGWLEILKACPISMDDLSQRSREYARKLGRTV